MKVKIKVTREILEESRMCGIDGPADNIQRSCAISQACRQIFGTVLVRTMEIEFTATGNIIRLPEKAVQFIRRFDISSPEARMRMAPIEFEIDVPQAVVDSINIDDLKECPTVSLVDS